MWAVWGRCASNLNVMGRGWHSTHYQISKEVGVPLVERSRQLAVWSAAPPAGDSVLLVTNSTSH